MAYSYGTSVAVNQLRAHVARVLDTHTAAQVRAWVAAWDDVAPDLEAALNELTLGAIDGRVRRTDVLRSQRLLNALEVIQGRLGSLVDDSASAAIDELAGIVDYAGAMQERIIASQLPRAAAADVAGWSRVSVGAVDAIVERSTEQITSLSKPLSLSANRAMRRGLVRGVAVGDNPRAVAARMLRDTEGTFNGGLGRALNIARTEILDAHRAAGALEDAANSKLLTGWVWTSALGARTCPACWAMHGREFPLEQPGPEDHQCGRCTRVPKSKTWQELGFDIDEPSSLARDATTAFEELSRDQQIEILGPARYAALAAGEFPINRWATKRSTPGWRDSWAVAPPPKDFRGIRAVNLPRPSTPGTRLVATPLGPDGEPMRRMLPASILSGVRSVPPPVCRTFDPISDYTVAAVSNPRRYLLPPEVEVADRLDGLGLSTLGVKESAGRRPDVVTVDKVHRVEIKTLTVASRSRIEKEARRGSLQSRRVVLDLSQTDLTRTGALRELARMARLSVGTRLDELGLLLADGQLVAWSRYE